VHGCVRLPDVVLRNPRLLSEIRDGDPRLEGFAPGDVDGIPERDMISVAIAQGLITRSSTGQISGA
jgi:hypothetical protein